MSSAFRHGKSLVGAAFVDKAREDRYFELGNALYDNPDLRFPNLDRVLPLPPAKLPPWDMNDVDGLIRAAQGVRVTPQLPPQPAASEPGRARIPPGHSLFMPDKLRDWAAQPIVGYRGILSAPGVRTGLSTAAFHGYYQPIHLWTTHPPGDDPGRIPVGDTETLRMHALARVPPLLYRMGELLSLAQGAYDTRTDRWFEQEGDHALVYWRYRGMAQPMQLLLDHLARGGLVQAIAQATDQRCVDGQVCPTSGIWQPEVTNAEHPLAKVFNGTLAGESWRRQAFVLEGAPLPSLGEQLAPLLGEGERLQLQVQWRLMVACEPACRVGFGASAVKGA
ncbi:MAG: hypothetical protein IIZ92_04775 [Aquincola sp.]|nr:hypothetical protein [Aquincola sp.]